VLLSFLQLLEVVKLFSKNQKDRDDAHTAVETFLEETVSLSPTSSKELCVGTYSQGNLNIEDKKIEQGFYFVQVVEDPTGKEVVEGIRKIVTGKKIIHFNEVSAGKKYFIVLTPVGPGSFLKLTKIGSINLIEYLKNTYGLSLYVEGEDVYLRTVDNDKIKLMTKLEEGENHIVYLKLGLAYVGRKIYALHIKGKGQLNTGNYNRPVSRIYDKLVKDSSGNVVARLIYIKYDQGIKSFAIYKAACQKFINFFSNECKILEAKGKEVSLKSYLKLVFEESVVEDVKDGREKAIILCQYKKGSEAELSIRPVSSGDLQVSGLKSGVKVLGLFIVNAKAEFSVSVKDVTIKFSSGLTQNTNGTYSKKVTIVAPSYEKSFDATITFSVTTRYGVFLKAKIRKLEFACKFDLDPDTKSLIYKPHLVGYGEIIEVKIKPDAKLGNYNLGDVISVFYKDGKGKIRSTSVSLTREHTRHHELVLFDFLNNKLSMVPTESWEYLNEEKARKMGSKKLVFDAVAGLPNGKKAIIEFKSNAEPSSIERLIDQANKYLSFCISKNEEYSKLVYVFEDLPTKENLKKLFNYLVKLRAEGKPIEILISHTNTIYSGGTIS
jgi:hypothetical protein